MNNKEDLRNELCEARKLIRSLQEGLASDNPRMLVRAEHLSSELLHSAAMIASLVRTMKHEELRRGRVQAT
jgi:hypothetical protein